MLFMGLQQYEEESHARVNPSLVDYDVELFAKQGNPSIIWDNVKKFSLMILCMMKYMKSLGLSSM